MNTRHGGVSIVESMVVGGVFAIFKFDSGVMRSVLKGKGLELVEKKGLLSIGILIFFTYLYIFLPINTLL